MSAERPPLTRELSAAQFLRWYWLKNELVEFAKAQSLRTSGDKPTIAERIVGLLDGSPSSGLQSVNSSRGTVSRWLPEPLTPDTVLGPRQASSQQLRAYFVDVIGSCFSYDIHMRTFLASDRDKTLGEAVDHWYSSRGVVKPATLPQLEFVRFTKAWHLQYTSGTQQECREAWNVHKSLPRGERPALPGID